MGDEGASPRSRRQPPDVDRRRLTVDDDELDAIARALAHVERRRILRACLREPRAAGDLAEPSALALASVSEHLRVLRTTGLIVLERDGRFRRYRTNRARFRAALAALRKAVDGA